MVVIQSKNIGEIDEYNNVRIQSEIIGEYRSIEYNAVFDSGFTGDLVLPQSMAVEIGLQYSGVAEVELADGSIDIYELYLCKVEIGDIVQEAATLILGGEVLLGMGLMTPFNICLSAGTAEVIIEPQHAYTDFVGMLRRLTGA